VAVVLFVGSVAQAQGPAEGQPIGPAGSATAPPTPPLSATPASDCEPMGASPAAPDPDQTALRDHCLTREIQGLSQQIAYFESSALPPHHRRRRWIGGVLLGLGGTVLVASGVAWASLANDSSADFNIGPALMVLSSFALGGALSLAGIIPLFMSIPDYAQKSKADPLRKRREELEQRQRELRQTQPKLTLLPSFSHHSVAVSLRVAL
jgi:hypothetical protein